MTEDKLRIVGADYHFVANEHISGYEVVFGKRNIANIQKLKNAVLLTDTLKAERIQWENGNVSGNYVWNKTYLHISRNGCIICNVNGGGVAQKITSALDSERSIYEQEIGKQ